MKLGALGEAKLHFSAAIEICEKLLEKGGFDDHELKDMLRASIIRINRGLRSVEVERKSEGKMKSISRSVSEDIIDGIANDMKRYHDIHKNTTTIPAAIKKPSSCGPEFDFDYSLNCDLMDGPTVLSDDRPPVPDNPNVLQSIQKNPKASNAISNKAKHASTHKTNDDQNTEDSIDAGIETIGDDQRAPVPFPDAAATQVTSAQSAFPKASNAISNKTKHASTHKTNDNQNTEDSIVIELPTTQPTAVGIAIPEAFVIVDPPAEIPSAEVVQLDKCTISVAGRKVPLGILVLAAIIILALVVGTVVGAARAKAGSDQGTNPTTKSLREQAIIDAIENHVLQRNITFDGLQKSDVRITALNWLLHDDLKQLSASDPSLFQRFILGLLVFQSNFDGVSSDFYNNGDECDWKGVRCSGGKVTSLGFCELLPFQS
jgi:hypothetical protein